MTDQNNSPSSVALQEIEAALEYPRIASNAGLTYLTVASNPITMMMSLAC